MTGAVEFLSDDALVKVAAYYGTLDPPRPAAAPKPAPSRRPDPLHAGKAAAEACAGCHGDNGVSKTPRYPEPDRSRSEYLASAIKAYKTGQRKHDLMKSLVAGVSDADVANVALYYALQKPARAAPSAGNAAAGKKAAAACAGCHGDTGVAPDPANPSLAGQDAQYLATATAGLQGRRAQGRDDEGHGRRAR